MKFSLLHRYFLMFLCTLCSLASTSSFALGKLGHQLTCELAYQQLSFEKQQTLTRLLNTVDSSVLLQLNKYNYQPASAPMTFQKACTWPDMVKNQPNYQQFKKWHYINVKRDQNIINKDTCQKDCITKAIPYHLQQFKSANKAQAKLEALMFLSHWLGDIHQPLHVSFASDLGGNKTQVRSKDGKCTNMHWLWDQCLLTRQITTSDHQKRYQFLLNTMQKRLKQAQSNNEIMVWKNTSVNDWANESLRLSRNAEVGYCELKNHRCVSAQQPIKLSNNYQAVFGDIINEQVVKASTRLAQLLERLL